MFNTQLTKSLGIQHPVIQGAMLWLSKAELVAAVSNSGGLGILSSASFADKAEFRAAVRKTKKLTDKPFGVNLVFLPSMREIPNDEYLDVILEEGVKVVETVGRILDSLPGKLHEKGIFWMHKVTTVRHAQKAENQGADAVVVEGYECAGHPGMDNVTTLVLIQRCVQALKVPVIAAGGFVDGKGLVSALALGAEAVMMGTRFLATQECPAHPNIKEWLVNARETDTALCLSSLGDPVRYMKTKMTDKILEMESRGEGMDKLLTLVSGRRYKRMMESGDLEDGVCGCGQCVGLIQDIPSVKELMDRIMDGAESSRLQLNAMAT